ncbi:MAG: acyl-CoA dehydrogenase [Actinobacteria bacterium]|nr:acyl-CoA dehydrogenase [Actinomycetota bacterium]
MSAAYAPPLRDIRFVLEHLVDLSGLSKLEPFRHADPDTVQGALEEFGRLMAEVWAPTNQIGDVEGSQLVDGGVRTPAVFKPAYRQYVDAGWPAVAFAPEYGGGGFPWLVGAVLQEMLNSANMALAMAPMLTHGAIDALALHGSEAQREVYLRRMVSGEWTGTMNLTEPEAGSDVGALRTRAVPQPDGTFRITGQKIFITFGDHDLTANVVHLVLARTPGAPPGTKGISCFIVPKFLVEPDGTLGARNDVEVVSLEHKLGIKASPTCVLAFGDGGEGAVGELIGEEHAGMRYMFTMMNNARLGVGIQALGLAERAYQAAIAYARERRQGRAPGAPAGHTSPIVEHPDVRRNLLTMKATTEAMRAMCLLQAEQIDLARHLPDGTARTAARELADLLTPMTKSWCTDMAETVTSIGVQVHGGMGYIEETGVAQHYRDAKITQIYEGTNGIQAQDLIGRKVPVRGGAVVAELAARMRATVEELSGAGEPLAGVHRELGLALDTLDAATAWLMERGLADPVEALGAATPYQRLFATTVAGWLMARAALAARRLQASGGGDLGAEFADAKLVTARFFVEQLLPSVHGLLAAVRAGAADLMALTPGQLALR